MTKPFLRSVLAGIAAAGVAAAQTPPTSTPPVPVVRQVAFKVPLAKPAGELVMKVFDVADLVSPPADSPLAKPGDDAAMKAAAKAFTEARAEQLMKIVRSTVDKDTWDDAGGPAKLTFNPSNQSLAVAQTPAGLERVAELLTALRKLTDTQVMVELRMLTVPTGNEAVKKLLGDKATAPLTAEQMKTFLDAVAADRAATVLCSPKMMLLNKQTGHCQVAEQRPFVTGLTAKVVGDKVVTTPQTETRSAGLTTAITPDVSADGKFVALRFRLEHSEFNPKGPQFPITTFVTPVFEGGSQGQPIPFTQFLQAPAVDCQTVETTLTVPDGGSVAVRVGTKKVERRVESKVPVLSEIPYINRLFRNTGISTESMDTVAVVTVRLVNVKKTPVAATAPPMLQQAAPVPTRPVAIPAPAVAQLIPPSMPVAPPMAVPERVGEIEIVGNAGTQKRVILKQLEGINPGQILDYSKLEEARKNLIRLGLFDTETPPTVEVLPPADPKSPFRDIRVTVKETRTGMISGQIGAPAQPLPVLPAVAPPKSTAKGGSNGVERSSHIRMDIVLMTVADGGDELAKLFGDQSKTSLTAEEARSLVAALRKAGKADVLCRPTLALTNRQTGFFQVGQQYPRLAGTAPAKAGGAAEQQIEYINTGIVVRATPVVAKDGKSVRARFEVNLTEPSRSAIDLGNGQKATPIDCQSVECDLNVPDGGTTAVRLGVMKGESKVPVLPDLPHLGRQSRNAGVGPERSELIALVTVNRADATTPIPTVPWAMPRVAATAPMPQAMPTIAPVAPPLPQAVPPLMPIPTPVALPGEVGSRWVVRPMPIPMVTTTGPDGLERVGVDFNVKPTATSVLAPVADPLMTAYRAACAAGRKDEAARLALQLLAKDPTCFGRDK